MQSKALLQKSLFDAFDYPSEFIGGTALISSFSRKASGCYRHTRDAATNNHSASVQQQSLMFGKSPKQLFNSWYYDQRTRVIAAAGKLISVWYDWRLDATVSLWTPLKVSLSLNTAEDQSLSVHRWKSVSLWTPLKISLSLITTESQSIQFNSRALLAWETCVNIAKASEVDNIQSEYIKWKTTKINSKHYTYGGFKTVKTLQMSYYIYIYNVLTMYKWLKDTRKNK